jgi:uncharacterized protein YprB with RNaseH-like and TPR domain
MYKENIGTQQVVEPGGIICVGYKWVGEREVEVLTEWELGSEVMLRRVHSLIESADLVVGKNSVRFDIPWIRTEFLKYGIGSMPPISHVDLEKVARYNFRFLSNKLDFICDYLGIGHKVQHEGFPLWRKVMEGNEVAQRKMKRYCAGDIRITERLYKKMRGYISDHPFMGDTPSDKCAVCGGPTEGRGWRRTKAFMIQKVHCLNKNCDAWRSGKRIMVSKWVESNGA